MTCSSRPLRVVVSTLSSLMDHTGPSSRGRSNSDRRATLCASRASEVLEAEQYWALGPRLLHDYVDQMLSTSLAGVSGQSPVVGCLPRSRAMFELLARVA